MKKKNIITTCLAVLAMTLVSSCSNDEGGEFLNHQTKSVDMKRFSIEKDAIRIYDWNYLQSLREAISKGLNIKVVPDIEDASSYSSNKYIPSLERMAPSESGTGSSSGTFEINATLYVRPIYAFKGDMNVKMETRVVLDSPTIYTIRGWRETKNHAEWRDRNSKVYYEVEGDLLVSYPVRTVNPVTKRDTIVTDYASSKYSKSGIYYID